MDDPPVTPLVHEVHTGFDESARFTVRDSKPWAGVWARAFAGRSEVPPRPSIDFSRHMVVVASQGGQPSSGYDISIDRVSSLGGSIAVEVTTTSPGQDCYQLAVITSPVMMVRVPVSTAPVRFVEHARIRRCE